MIFYTHERNFGCRLTEYVYKGLRTVTLENELLRASVLAGKGTDIFELLYKPLDVDFMWRSPWGVRNPAGFVPTTHTAASSFLDFYEGGWQDCMPTGGNPCEYLGLPFGAHGETPTLPWDYRVVEDTPERVAVRFWVRTCRTPFYVEKDIALERGRAALLLDERITNEGRVPMHLMWGQHPAFGAPFVDESCVIDLPGGRVHCAGLAANTRFVEGVHAWPHVPGRDGETIDLRKVASVEADTTDTLRIDGLPEGWYAITNTRRRVGFGLAWPLKVFPAVWFWQVYGGAYNPPWYGRTYNIALEPFSTTRLTLPEAIQDGSAHRLEPGGSLQARFAAVAYEGAQGVERVTPDGEVIQFAENR
jgi:hypothetical protein